MICLYENTIIKPNTLYVSFKKINPFWGQGHQENTVNLINYTGFTEAHKD